MKWIKTALWVLLASIGSSVITGVFDLEWSGILLGGLMGAGTVAVCIDRYDLKNRNP